MLKSPRILRRVSQERLGKLEIRTRFKTIQTTAMLKSDRILRRVQQERLGKLEIRTFQIQDHPDTNEPSSVKLPLESHFHDTPPNGLKITQRLGKLEIRTRFKTIQTTAMLKLSV